MHNKRYNKQIQLSEIGISGQEKLGRAKILVIGAGGLGCPVLQNLAGAGVGHIGIVDGDVVEETNLHRQFLYVKEDCGKLKVKVAAEAILKQNPEVEVIPYTDYFTTSNAFEIASDYQIIVDCTDNNVTRYLINDVALAKGIPMVYASIHKFEGQLSVFNYKNGPSYRCLFPEPVNSGLVSNCNDSGVLGVLPNVLGVMQANEVLKIILEIGEVLSGVLLLYNGLNVNFQKMNFQKNKLEIDKGLQNGQAILNLQETTEVKIIKAKEFWQIIDNPNVLVVDIRESYEEPKLDIPTITKVPLAQLEGFLKTSDKDRRIVLFCQRGQTSLMAAKYLTRKGFSQVFHLENGIHALEKDKTNSAINP
ncbi:ThiF family adenylyltransferase [Flavobacterium sp. XGLA_31]|uniref:ThiF family adenylyltransferase n=1 Tax=Flavobacterium sp. XGLA_31 TaxID=3447666 RepID=UPI003F2F298F